MRTFKVITEARACKEIPGYTPVHNKPFGYVVQIIPPVISYTTGEDIEGIGWFQYQKPKKHIRNIACWTKRKALALCRLKECELSSYWRNLPDGEVDE